MRYTVKSRLLYNEKRYPVGAELDVKDKATAEALLDLGVIEAPAGKPAASGKKAVNSEPAKTGDTDPKGADSNPADDGVDGGAGDDGGVQLPGDLNPDLIK